jgi:hypothetical protein
MDRYLQHQAEMPLAAPGVRDEIAARITASTVRLAQLSSALHTHTHTNTHNALN